MYAPTYCWCRLVRAISTTRTHPRHLQLRQALLDFQDNIPVPSHAFDMWSTGSIVLEMLLGTRAAFQAPPRVQAILQKRLAGKPRLLRRATYLAALASFCIFTPEHTLWLDDEHASWHDVPGLPLRPEDGKQPSTCGVRAFNTTLVHRDPLGLGFGDNWGLRLLWRMLQWDPRRRITAKEALAHVRCAWLAGSV